MRQGETWGERPHYDRIGKREGLERSGKNKLADEKGPEKRAMEGTPVRKVLTAQAFTHVGQQRLIRDGMLREKHQKGVSLVCLRRWVNSATNRKSTKNVKRKGGKITQSEKKGGAFRG